MIINYSNGFQLDCKFWEGNQVRDETEETVFVIMESLEAGEMYGGNNQHHTDFGLWHHERSIECDQKEK